MAALTGGLSAAEVERSRAQHGDNSLHRERQQSFLRKFFINLSDPIIRVLLIAVAAEMLFSLGHCNWWELGGILLTVLIATTVSTVSEYGSERAFARMSSGAADARVRVLREGRVTEIPLVEVVVGDTVLLSAGEQIPADGVLLEGRLLVDQSTLNGESAEVEKYPSPVTARELGVPGALFRGTLIAQGSGCMRVTEVGASTFYGMVARDVQVETRESPLKLRLSRLATQISRLGYAMAITVALAYLFGVYVLDNRFVMADIWQSMRNLPFVMATLSHALTLMITVIVVAVPEGLPMMITVVLSANMRRMLRDGVMVKKLVGIETAGSLNILFTDKTGTLTEGRMLCDRVITSHGIYRTARHLQAADAIYTALLTCAYYNTDATLGPAGAIGGNGTDRAVLDFFAGEQRPVCTMQERTPFSSERKWASLTVAGGERYVMGAPELLLPRCRYVLGRDGTRLRDGLSYFAEQLHGSAAQGERVLAVTVCPAEGGDNEMTLVALLVLRDRLRHGIRAAVSRVQQAGIQVVMMTGDSVDTATAIARECGILSQTASGGVYSREQLAAMSDSEVMTVLPGLRVIARALPQDKTRLVRLSQQMELVVGMTGDGVNDAPALKRADVGFAMGSGTELAKDAADIVLLTDGFETIGNTVLYGRTIFKSIRKFIVFQLTMNLAACGVSLLGQLMGIENPITILQMLWVNIIMDTLGGLAFSGEPPIDYYMRERPKGRAEPILTREMMSQVACTGAYTLLICLLFLSCPCFRLWFRGHGEDLYFMTGFYALFVFAGLFNCLSARSERLWLFSHIGENPRFVFILALISVIQLVMIYWGGEMFRTLPLTASELARVILLALTVIPFELIRRILYKLRPLPARREGSAQPARR